jgi:hypothetical protein
MQKLFSSFIFCLFFIFLGCHTSPKELSANDGDENNPSIFPVTSFLKGQLLEIDSMETTPLKITAANGKTDSVWLKREDVRAAAAPFLTPVIDSATMSSLFSVKSFLDQTIHAYTFTNDPKVKLPDSISLRHWDVYMSPETNKVTRIYMVKEKMVGIVKTTTQLTWFSNKWFSIRTITQAPEKKPEIKEEKMIWDFEE